MKSYVHSLFFDCSSNNEQRAHLMISDTLLCNVSLLKLLPDHVLNFDPIRWKEIIVSFVEVNVQFFLVLCKT